MISGLMSAFGGLLYCSRFAGHPHDTKKNPLDLRLPSGKLTVCELENYHSEWVNPLFRLGHFQ